MQVAEKTTDSVNFDDIAALVSDDIEAVNDLITKSLESDVALVSKVSEYIVIVFTTVPSHRGAFASMRILSC